MWGNCELGGLTLVLQPVSQRRRRRRGSPKPSSFSSQVHLAEGPWRRRMIRRRRRTLVWRRKHYKRPNVFDLMRMKQSGNSWLGLLKHVDIESRYLLSHGDSTCKGNTSTQEKAMFCSLCHVLSMIRLCWASAIVKKQTKSRQVETVITKSWSVVPKNTVILWQMCSFRRLFICMMRS